MNNVAKKILCTVGALCWFGFALACGFFLLQYVTEGAGLQIFGWAVSAGSVLLGLVHVVGFCTASLVCMGIGLSIWARGFESGREDED
jgi:hypothetical protein